MARARNIKPSFFTNDELAECDPLARLLFIGLWTIADHNGNIEWRSKKIKAQILPYDDCNIDALGITLDKSRFIRFYSDGVKKYAHIVQFTKHQRPHKNEVLKGTAIPTESECETQLIENNSISENHDLSRLNHDENVTHPPDPCFLIPDPLYPSSEGETHAHAQGPEPPVFKNPSPYTTPSLDDVKAFCLEHGLEGTDPEKFFYHYESQGWIVKGQRISSWTALLRKWNRKDQFENRNSEPVKDWHIGIEQEVF